MTNWKMKKNNFCVKVCRGFMYIDPPRDADFENAIHRMVGGSIHFFSFLFSMALVLVSYDKTFLCLVGGVLGVTGAMLTYMLTEPLRECPNMAHVSHIGAIIPVWERLPHWLTPCINEAYHQ